MYRTWARVGQTPVVPVTGERQSVKVFACVEIYAADFLHRRDSVFNGENYLDFLDGKMAPRFYRRRQKVIYIQDNASYNKEERVWEWFAANRRWMEVHALPPYSPELNAVEPLCHHTRVSATHNRCFRNVGEIADALEAVFGSIRRHPDQILGYLRPFQ